MPQLDIRLLGPFQVFTGRNAANRFETDPTRALLVYLVTHAGTSFQREVLADLLWPNRQRTEALHALRQTLNRLRIAIGDREAKPSFLHITRKTIEFNSDSDYCLDIDDFIDLVSAIRKHRHRRLETCPSCRKKLEQAADLYRGDLVSGLNLDSLPFEEWLLMEREHLHRQAMETFYQLAVLNNRWGEYEQAQRYARQHTKLEPWGEEAHRQLMLALAHSGRRSAALAQYQTCSKIMMEELGVEPEAATRKLYEQIRDGNLDQSTPSHNLPADLTRFVGRETELGQIAEYLNDPDCRLLTLLGPGGIGKTRLALASAERSVPLFRDGVWFVPQFDDTRKPAADQVPDMLATVIAEAMELTISELDSPQTQLFRALRTKDALLILDGFERWVSAADLILEMLRQAPRLMVLVTSRVQLDAQAEHILHVTGLPVPHDDDDPAAADYDSVQLFMDRVGRTAGGVIPDLPMIVQLCRLVEGLPLAIELASAWMEHLPLVDIITNLGQGLELLSSTQRDIPARHRCLHAVFESSWQLLSESEQKALAQLTVFRGDFSRDAVLEVTEGQPTELLSLVNKSLVRRIASGRYTLHALIRQFALEKLEALPKIAETYQRHSDYYLLFVCQRAAAFQGGNPQRVIVEIQAEIANIRQAWQWTVDQLDSVQNLQLALSTLAQCTQGLVQFYTHRGPKQEGEQIFGMATGRVQSILKEQETASLSEDQLAPTRQALWKLLAAQGDFLLALGDHKRALTVLEEANAGYERVAAIQPDADLAERAMMLVNLGTTYNRLGDYPSAAEYLETGLDLARQADDPQTEIKALSTWAQAAAEQGVFDQAKKHLDQVLELARALGDQISEAEALAMQGSVAWRWGDLERADECSQQGLAIYRELGNKQRISRLLNTLGILAILRENYDRAQEYIQEGISLAKEIGDRQVTADMLNNLGYINHHCIERFDAAKRYYRESAAVGREIGHRHGVTSTLSNLGHLHVLMGEYQAAWDYLRDALHESIAIGVVPLTLDALIGVAQLWTEKERYVLAAELLGLALNHPAAEASGTQAAEPVLAKLREQLPAEQFEAATERGKVLELDAVLANLLAESE